MRNKYEVSRFFWRTFIYVMNIDMITTYIHQDNNHGEDTYRLLYRPVDDENIESSSATEHRVHLLGRSPYSQFLWLVFEMIWKMSHRCLELGERLGNHITKGSYLTCLSFCFGISIRNDDRISISWHSSAFVTVQKAFNKLISSRIHKLDSVVFTQLLFAYYLQSIQMLLSVLVPKHQLILR